MAAKLSLDSIKTAAHRGGSRDPDYQEVIKFTKKISPDSIYFERAKALHDEVRDLYVKSQVDWGRAKAERHECATIQTRIGQVYWKEAAAALGAIPCEGRQEVATPVECRQDSDCTDAKLCKANRCVARPAQTTEPRSCDARALFEEARAAYAENQWSKVLAKAEASNRCSPSSNARQIALAAACKLLNKEKAAKYWREFENHSYSRQQCLGVMP